MNSIVQVFQNLGPARMAAIGGVAVLVMAFFIFMMTRLTSPQMALLYSDLDPSETTAIANQLAAQQVPFEQRANGTEILVPADRVTELRLAMAEQGLGGRIPGYELLDRQDGFGKSSREMQINERRALEGELARTISSIDQVRSARVHIVLPQRELFSREVREPSASIVLRMRGSQRLDRQQVLAVQHLVATAVERLKPANITIADDRGALLARGGTDDELSMATLHADELRRNYESRLAQRLEQLVESIVGFGRVRVEVNARIDMSQTVQNSETYDPEGQVLRSTESIEESTSIRDAGDQAVTIGNNLPDAADAFGDGGGASENTSRLEERSNFEISRTVINTVKAPGDVQSVSVAVLVDGSYEAAQPGEGPEGATPRQYVPRSAEELQQIDALVKSAIGYNEAVDMVEIVNMRFAEAPDLEPFEPDTLLGFDARSIGRAIEVVVIAIVAILVILLVVRPLISKIFETAPVMTGEFEDDEGPAMITDQSGQLAPAGRPGAPTEEEEELDAMIDIAHIEGRVKASSMKKVGEIIDKHPEEAVSILRNWMYQDAS